MIIIVQFEAIHYMCTLRKGYLLLLPLILLLIIDIVGRVMEYNKIHSSTCRIDSEMHFFCHSGSYFLMNDEKGS